MSSSSGTDVDISPFLQERLNFLNNTEEIAETQDLARAKHKLQAQMKL